MLIIADENLPLVTEAFSTFGEVQLVSGFKITPDIVKNADILVVRYITKVNEALLKQSKVKFVATASIGYEHIDTKYLLSKGIGFANAPGSNSNSVAEYLIASLLFLNETGKISIKNSKLGIVGVGNVGSKVASKAQSLGFKVLLNDPPLARKQEKNNFVPLNALMDCDVISLHVPLSYNHDVTYQLFDEKRISLMKKGSILINTSRGKVIKQSALKSVLKNNYLSGAILDVWEDENVIDKELLKLVDIGTPHIAGFSYDGRLNGIKMIYKDACSFFGLKNTWDCRLPAPNVTHICKNIKDKQIYSVLYDVVKCVYDIGKDDRSFRNILKLPAHRTGKYFIKLRRNYSKRREFFNTSVRLFPTNKTINKMIKYLGFKN